MSNLSDVIAAPAPSGVNGGLSPCGTANMIRRLGVPGLPTKNCSPVRNKKIISLLVTAQITPHIRVTGLKPAVESLQRIFEKVKKEKPRVYAEARTAGMLCNRLIRGSRATYSIHSWGNAIDLYFGSGVVPLGTRGWHRGVAELYPYFHNEGWYAGVEFSRCDGMHLETASELVARWEREGKLRR